MDATRTFVTIFMLAFVRDVSGQTLIPGETEAMRIEDIYYDQGPQQALEALTQDYRKALGGSGPQAGRQQIDDEVSRLEAHTTRYAKYSPLVSIATQWCLGRHEARDFPLHYGELLPTSDASPDARRRTRPRNDQGTAEQLDQLCESHTESDAWLRDR
jgi:hypothetical protein